LFNWLFSEFSLQGISDQVARTYLKKHGNASWTDIAGGLRAKPPCPLLKNFWSYDRCHYHKLSGCCSEPDHIDQCPVPSHRLRNGRLNQTAYSLFLFIRDIANNDLVAWIDHRIAEASWEHAGAALFHHALISPMSGIYGVSDKVLTMSLSGLLLCAEQLGWLALGAQATVVDTLAGVDKWEAAGFLGMSVEILERVYGHHHPLHLKQAALAIGYRRNRFIGQSLVRPNSGEGDIR
jgi:hypothetical protein